MVGRALFGKVHIVKLCEECLERHIDAPRCATLAQLRRDHIHERIFLRCEAAGWEMGSSNTADSEGSSSTIFHFTGSFLRPPAPSRVVQTRKIVFTLGSLVELP